MLIRTIEKFLSQTDMRATTFGRLVANDPRLVFDLRRGREPRPSMCSRAEHFMNKYLEKHHAR
ncbi:MAG: hypothetical protein ACEQR8_02615 [Cypionkella sp.]